MPGGTGLGKGAELRYYGGGIYNNRKEAQMGKLRDEAKWPDDVYYGGDHTYISNSEKLDCPQAPARILLDDIEQEIVTDMGLDLDEGLYCL